MNIIDKIKNYFDYGVSVTECGIVDHVFSENDIGKALKYYIETDEINGKRAYVDAVIDVSVIEIVEGDKEEFIFQELIPYLESLDLFVKHNIYKE